MASLLQTDWESAMNSAQFIELLLQSLEHERGGVKVYTTALKCAQRPDLQAEWEKYLSQTEEHVSALTELCEVFDIDPFTMTPGTQIVAAECVVLAETKDHLNWELLGEAAKTLSGEEREALQQAYEKIEEQEDEHLYHTQGWCRELWLDSLGLEAELPPPEERQDVTSAAEAQHAKETRVPRH